MQGLPEHRGVEVQTDALPLFPSYDLIQVKGEVYYKAAPFSSAPHPMSLFRYLLNLLH